MADAGEWINVLFAPVIALGRVRRYRKKTRSIRAPALPE